MKKSDSTNKKVLMVCNSVYQILVAVHLKLNYYADDAVDLIVSDQMNNSRNIADRITKIGLFRQVIHINNKKEANGKFTQKAVETWSNLKIIRDIYKKNGVYDVLCVSNIAVFTILLYNYLRRKKPLELCIFEDGFSTYSNFFKNSDKATFIHRFINKKGMIGSASKLYLFNPQLLEWKMPDGEVVAMNKIQPKSDEVEILNRIFDIQKADKYDAPMLFMEESFFADGFEVEDVEIVNEIAKHFGKERVMIKTHPRNPVNRFAELGYKTNKNTEIPWELIVLNQDISKKILITISSSAVLTPFLLFDIPVKSYSLLKMLKNKPGNMQGELGKFMEKVYDLYPNHFFAPETQEELLMDIQKTTV